MVEVVKPKVIELSWADIEKSVEFVRGEIASRKFFPGAIVTIQRGGLIPAVMISHKLAVRDIFILNAERTDDDRVNARKHEVEISFSEVDFEGLTGKNVLLIDDIVGSGETLKKAKEVVTKFKPHSLISAALVVNLDNLKDQNLKPDICCREVNGWIIFPWESKP